MKEYLQSKSTEGKVAFTTPQVIEYDPVFPGENLFFYWRTSPSLWEVKLSEYMGPSPIFIPVFWGYHSEYENIFDFANSKPETDLAKLFNIAEKLGKEIALLVPLTPFPFLPNGGVPAYVAKKVSKDRNGMTLAVVDNDNSLNKIYSFFEPSVFMAFKKFTYHLGQYVSQAGISARIYGLKCNYVHKDDVISYIEDTSEVYEQGFQRYLNANKDTIHIENIEDEKEYHHAYVKLIEDLYYNCAKESLAGNWSGVVHQTFLGGATEDLFSRNSDIWENSAEHFRNFQMIISRGSLPSSSLFPYGQKKGVLNKALKDNITTNLIKVHTEADLFDDEVLSSFGALSFFYIYAKENKEEAIGTWLKSIGLYSYLGSNYRWLHSYVSDLLDFEESEDLNRKVFFINGSDFNKNDFSNLIKLLMNGAKIIIDKKGLSPEIEKKFNIFFIENNIETEEIFFLSKLIHAKLGDGLLVLFDSNGFKEHSALKLISLWDKLITYMNIKHLFIETDEEIYTFWKTRLSNPMELNYEEIRRVSLYNSSSYVKKAKFSANKNFALLKVVDEINCQVKNTPIATEVQLAPGGSISFDFGYYE